MLLNCTFYSKASCNSTGKKPPQTTLVKLEKKFQFTVLFSYAPINVTPIYPVASIGGDQWGNCLIGFVIAPPHPSGVTSQSIPPHQSNHARDVALMWGNLNEKRIKVFRPHAKYTGAGITLYKTLQWHVQFVKDSPQKFNT